MRKYTLNFSFAILLLVQSIVVDDNGFNADFTPNEAGGWGAYNSYMGMAGDSVQLDLIVYRIASDSIEFNTDYMVGTINEAYHPTVERTAYFNMAMKDWVFRVTANGAIWLKYVSGSYVGEPPIVAFQVKYKR